MPKKTLNMILAFLVGALALGGCSSSSTSASTEDVLASAVRKNMEIENGRFEMRLTMNTESEQIEQPSEGAFIRTGDENYNWYHKTLFPAQGERSHEFLELDGKQYQRSTIDAQTATEWMELPEPVTTFREVVSAFFKLGVEESEIEDSEVTEKEAGVTAYTLTLKADAYTERIRNENKQAIEKSIAKLEASNAEEFQIEAMEAQLQNMSGITFEDVVTTYEINDEGFLTVVTFKARVIPVEEEAYTFQTNFALVDYNLKDTTNLLPQIE